MLMGGGARNQTDDEGERILTWAVDASAFIGAAQRINGGGSTGCGVFVHTPSPEATVVLEVTFRNGDELDGGHTTEEDILTPLSGVGSRSGEETGVPRR